MRAFSPRSSVAPCWRTPELGAICISVFFGLGLCESVRSFCRPGGGAEASSGGGGRAVAARERRPPLLVVPCASLLPRPGGARADPLEARARDRAATSARLARGSPSRPRQGGVRALGESGKNRTDGSSSSQNAKGSLPVPCPAFRLTMPAISCVRVLPRQGSPVRARAPLSLPAAWFRRARGSEGGRERGRCADDCKRLAAAAWRVRLRCGTTKGCVCVVVVVAARGGVGLWASGSSRERSQKRRGRGKRPSGPPPPPPPPMPPPATAAATTKAHALGGPPRRRRPATRTTGRFANRERVRSPSFAG